VSADVVQAARHLLALDAARATPRLIGDAAEPGLVYVQAVRGRQDLIPVRFEVVDPSTMPRASGETVGTLPPVARFDYSKTSGEYTIQLSARARPQDIERALAHELAEIRVAHAAPEIGDALQPGGFGSRRQTRRDEAQLSPHDHGRLAEIEVLARQIEAASTDPAQTLRLRDETQFLLAHMGLSGDTRAAQARRQAALAALADSPAAARLIELEAAAAADNPFLQPPPATPREYVDHLLRQLEYARTVGDGYRAAQVIEQARRVITFEGNHESENAVFQAPNGRLTKYRSSAVAARATSGQAPRSALLHELIAHVRRASPAAGPDDLSQRFPDVAAAVAQRYADYERVQTWEQFLRVYDPDRTSTTIRRQELFVEWLGGKFASSRSSTAELARSTNIPDVRARRVIERPDATLRPVDPIDSAGTITRHKRSVDELLADRERLTARRNILQQELAPLQQTLEATTDVDQRGLLLKEQIAPRIKELNQIVGGELSPVIERLSEAAAVRFARQRLGIPDAAQIVLHGDSVPDLIHVDEVTGRVTVIEAKGGNATLRSRLSKDATQLVQQGSFKYLDSLAQEMQQSGDDQLFRLGQALEAALRTPDPKDPARPNVGYHLVRQPFIDANLAASSPGPITNLLSAPRVAEFTIRLDDRDRDTSDAPRTRP